MRLYSHPGNDLTYRFSLIVEALTRLRSRSCIIDGEAVCCDDSAMPSIDRIRYRRHDASVFLLPNGVTKQWTLALRKAGLTATLHSLRHAHASTLIAAGLDVLTISRRLGHRSPAITLGVYGHLFRPDDRAAAIMEQALTGME